MSGGRPRAILFVSTAPSRAAELAARVRARWPEHEWTLCVKARELPGGWHEGPTIALPRRRPGLSVARRLRREGFDLAVAAWTGEGGYLRLVLLHLLTPARERHVFDGEGVSFALRGAERDAPWRACLRAAIARRGPFLGLGRIALRVYGSTLGPVLGAGWVVARYALLALGAGPRPR